MSFVYCIGERPGGPVKIGIAGDVPARLATLQTGNHAELRVIWAQGGGAVEEAALHARFSHLRIRGEWFMDCGYVISRAVRRSDEQEIHTGDGDVKVFADAIGRGVLAEALTVGVTAVSNGVVRGSFPASWYVVCRSIADERGIACPIEMFAMKSQGASPSAPTAGIN